MEQEMSGAAKIGRPVSRRAFMGAAAASMVLLSMRSSEASGDLGVVVSVRGMLNRVRDDGAEMLNAGTALNEGDLISTSADSFAELRLGGDTRILLGPQTELLVDSFLAGQGGILELASGQMVFDRPEGLPKIDVSVRTAFGMIGVRGTKFFAGPLRDAFSVYVEHGKVEVSNAGVTRKVLKGEGVDISVPASNPRALGAPSSFDELTSIAVPSVPERWDGIRVAEAYKSVGLDL